MKLLRIQFMVVLSAVIIGCSPTHTEKKEMVRCLSNLKLAYVDCLEFLGKRSTESPEETLARCLRLRSCPSTGAPFMANPGLEKWNHPQAYPGEIALLCTQPHFKGLRRTLFTAVTFEGATIKTEHPPAWAFPTNAKPRVATKKAGQVSF